MIKANELRIGNETTFGKVYQIEKDCFYTMKDEVSYKSKWAAIEPISLTPEILEKCGFIKKVGTTANPNAIYFDFSGYRIYYSEEFISIHLDEGSWFPRLTELKYVHTFQNWYFFNTGEELETAF